MCSERVFAMRPCMVLIWDQSLAPRRGTAAWIGSLGLAFLSENKHKGD